MKFSLSLVLFFSLISFSTFASQLSYVDIRDHIKYSPLEYSKVSRLLFDHVSSNICDFVSPLNENMQSFNKNLCNQKMKYTKEGALGPLGNISDDKFLVSDSREETRTNLIFSVEIEEDAQIKGLNLKSLKVILFIHDETQYNDSNNFFFRRFNVTVDTESGEFFIDDFLEDIPLNQTQFSFFSDVLERKTILIDKLNRITKVFPIATGAFDIRTLPGMDGHVASMTEDLKDDARIYPSQPAGLYEERRNKAIYRNRPFLGIVDNSGTTYKEIGWHYKMTEGDLLRAFSTHGCMRTDDKDLYQMSAIVFYSKQNFIPIKVVQSFTFDDELTPLINLNHPMPLENNFYTYINYYNADYSSRENQSKVLNSKVYRQPRSTPLSEVERLLWCRHHGEAQPIRSYGTWSSALDSLCLTKTRRKEESALPIINYILNPKVNDRPYFSQSFPKKPKMMNGLCTGSLTAAFNEYKRRTNNELLPEDNLLNFPTYIANCGCNRFEEVLRPALIRFQGKILLQSDKNDILAKYCSR